MSRSRQTGLAMVIVIWVLTLLTIMAGSFALTMRRETTVISAVKDNAVGLAVAETGLAIAQQMLMLEDENMRWRADGSIYQVQYQDFEIRVRLLSEQGKIDINKADEVLLTAMVNTVPVEADKKQELVGAIIDWRDKDDLVQLNGAEKNEYEDAGLAYQPANSAFQLIDELRLVLGMNATVFQKLQPLVTVYSEQNQVNLSVAPKEVLQLVTNLDPVLLDEYLQLRIENNKAHLPAPEFPMQENSEDNSNDGIGVRANSGNQVYTVISQVRLYGEESGGGIKAIIKKIADIKQTNPFQVLDWQQIYQELSLFSDEMEQLLVTVEDEPEHRF